MQHLSQRSEIILKALIETYLVDGEPVGSRVLAERLPSPVSSATVRNILADLEEEFLLSQPHTSAGRVPTERAYRYYVDRWVRPEQPSRELGSRLASTLEGFEHDPDQWLRHASRVLSEVIGGVCIALPLHFANSTLLRLEFVPLGDKRIVAVWVGSSGDVEHQVMENRWKLDGATLMELGNFASQHFCGHTLAAMRKKLFDKLRDQADEAQTLRQRLSDIAEKMEDHSNPDRAPLVVSGLRELLRMPEFEDSRRFRELVETFEEHERLARLLNAFAEVSSREVQLLLGSENPYLSSMGLATAMKTVPIPGDYLATFAFIGPLRLDYARLLGTLLWWSEEVERKGQAIQKNALSRPFREITKRLS